MNVKNYFIDDHLFIDNLEMEVRIGTTPEEKAFPQVVFISAKIFLPLARAGKTDALQETLDYAEIISKIKTHLTEKSFNLVEKVAEDTADIALHYRGVVAVWVRVAKKIFAGIEYVGAEIYRTK